jgi:single-strand DNA-binding protein
MNETPMTMVGNVATKPQLKVTTGGHSVTNFLLASTPRRYDAAQGRFVDGETVFLNVSCWRRLAEHVESCVKTGDPVIVTGRFRCREYEKDETKAMAYSLEASAIGFDLSRGTAEFSKTQRPGAPLSVPVDENGMPVVDADEWATTADRAPEREAVLASASV